VGNDKSGSTCVALNRVQQIFSRLCVKMIVRSQRGEQRQRLPLHGMMLMGRGWDGNEKKESSRKKNLSVPRRHYFSLQPGSSLIPHVLSCSGIRAEHALTCTTESAAKLTDTNGVLIPGAFLQQHLMRFTCGAQHTSHLVGQDTGIGSGRTLPAFRVPIT
jgi:hypothetical protein